MLPYLTEILFGLCVLKMVVSQSDQMKEIRAELATTKKQMKLMARRLSATGKLAVGESGEVIPKPTNGKRA